MYSVDWSPNDKFIAFNQVNSTTILNANNKSIISQFNIDGFSN